MRLGYYDCLKLPRKMISGQLLGTFSVYEKVHSQALMKGCKNLDVIPVMDKEANYMSEWYTEIMNTYLTLEMQ